MKLQIFSDIHGEAYHETGFIWDYVEPAAPIAVVAGDIHSRKFEEMVNEIATKFERVICVLGNHEWYRRDISWRPDGALMNPKVTVLDRNVLEIDDVAFVGATLWTDFKRQDFHVMTSAKTCINDFKMIRTHNGTDPFTPKMAVEKYLREKEYIDLLSEKYRTKKLVIVTHFMPSYKLVREHWKQPHSDLLNYYFSASCDDLIEKSEAKLWINGHTHDAYDEVHYGVRCVCNPLGYPGENKEYNKSKVVEI